MKPKILLVDDEPLNLATFQLLLAAEDYELHATESGAKAFALARAIQPDLMLLDAMMPELDGFEVCRRVRKDPVIGRMPVIFVTALHDSRSRLQALEAGADDLLTKPCQREELLARVRTVVSLNRFRTIAQQRERFQRLYEMAPAAIVLADDAGRVIAANPLADTKFASASGRPLAGDILFSRFDARAAELLRDALAAAWRKEPVAGCELRTTLGGDERIMQVRATLVPDNAVELAMLVFDDITAAVQAREALERMNAELEQRVRARTAELEEANGLLMSYASFVSHDLRSPLTVMKGYLAMLHEGAVPLDRTAAPLIGQAFNAATIMQETLNNILQLARDEHLGRQTGDVPSTDPTPIARHVAMHVRNLYPRVPVGIRIADLPRVGVSPVVLERVFYNLIGNALKYSEGQPQAIVEVGALPDSESPVLYVRDHGIGFDPRDAGKLFHEFSRLPGAARRGGCGLGLSLVARLVRMHRGRIWAEGSPGRGATFYVQLPPPGHGVEPVPEAACPVGNAGA